MPIVAMPDNTQVSFPDDMPADQIRSLIQSKFPDAVGGLATGDSAAFPGVPQGAVDAARAAHNQLSSGLDLSKLDPGIRSIANGATFGFADRLAAAGDKMVGNGDYSTNLTKEQQKTATNAAQNPVGDLLGQGVGGALTMGVAGIPAAAAKAPLWLKSLYGSLLGAGTGALYGTSSSKDLTDLGDTAKNAAVGAGTGAAIGATVPVIGAGISRIVSPPNAVDAIAARANISPDVAKRAHALMDDGLKTGMPLNLQEAIDKASGGKTALSDLTRVVSNTPEGRPIMDAFYNKRPGQIQAAGAAQLDNLAPNPISAAKAGLDVQSGANDIVDTTRRAINASEGPFYKAAESAVISPDAMSAVTSDPQANAAFQWARNKVLSDPIASAKFVSAQPPLPAPGSTISAADYAKLKSGSEPQNTVGFLGAVRKQLADTVQSLTQEGKPASARNFMPALNGLDQALKTASPDYAKALEVGATLRQADLNPVENSIIGKVANQSDLGQQASTVFPSNPVYGTQDVSRLSSSLYKDNPKAAEALVRAHLQRAFSESTQNLQGGPNVMGAANFAAKIAGNSDQARALESFIRSAPNGDAKWEGFRRFLDISEATGMKPAMGSNTAYDTKALGDLAGSTPLSLAKDVAKSGGTIVTQIPRRLSDWYTKVSLGNNIEQVAKILTDPRGGKILERLATLPQNDPTAQMLAYRLTFLGNAAVDRKMRQ